MESLANPKRLTELVKLGRDTMASSLSGKLDGFRICREFSDGFDGLLKGLFEEIRGASQHPRVLKTALVATGGYGRHELCAYSDIDLLWICDEDAKDDVAKFAEDMLYPLWDAKIKVGHAIRSLDECMGLVKDDLPTATALLDARHIAGDTTFVKNLHHGLQETLAPKGNADRMVRRLSAERSKRHGRFGASIYLLEPDLKHSIGALRDLATAVWISRTRWKVSKMDELVDKKVINPRQLEWFRKGGDFLLALRCKLHLAAGRSVDQLTFEHQEELGAIMYPNAVALRNNVSAVTPSVEELMRTYYLHARQISRVSTRLLEAATIRERRRLGTRFPIDEDFESIGGDIAARHSDVFSEKPSSLIRIFDLAAEFKAEIHGPTTDWIESAVAKRKGAVLADADAKTYFLKRLCDVEDQGRPTIMERVHELGVLNVLLPEFEPCTCRVQHDLYHVYTVDQHQLYALAHIKKTLGEPSETPALVRAVSELNHSPVLFLATLLHDVAKPKGKGHSEKGAVMARQVAQRLGLSPDEISRTEFLVRQHLTMVHISQRRDLSDPLVIEKFAALVGDTQLLTELFLLTRSDTAMTAPNNLSSWKDELLSELYLKTIDFLDGKDLMAHDGNQKLLERVKVILNGQSAWEPEFENFIESLSPRFLSGMGARTLARQIKLFRDYLGGGQKIAIQCTPQHAKGHSELAVVCRDRSGLLRDIAGALARQRINVSVAQVGLGHWKGIPVAMDLFLVSDSQGNAISEDSPKWEKVLELFQGNTKNAIDPEQVASMISEASNQSVLAPPVTPGVMTQVELLNDASVDATVVEVYTQDRMGLLHAIAEVFDLLNLEVQLAKINTAGEKAEDIFYVVHRKDGKKIQNEELKTKLKAMITDKIERWVA